MPKKDLGKIICEIKEVNATVDSGTGVPSASATITGTLTEKTINFEFKNLKGDKPVKGVDYLTEEEEQQFSKETTDVVRSEGQKVIEQVKTIVSGNPATTNALTLSGKTRVEFDNDIETAKDSALRGENVFGVLSKNKILSCYEDKFLYKNTPTLSSLYVPITVMIACKINNFNFNVKSDKSISATVKFIKLPNKEILTKSVQLNHGETNISFEINKFIETGEYKIEIKTNEAVLWYPYVQEIYLQQFENPFVTISLKGTQYQYENKNIRYCGKIEIESIEKEKYAKASELEASILDSNIKLDKKLDKKLGKNLCDPQKNFIGYFAFDFEETLDQAIKDGIDPIKFREGEPGRDLYFTTDFIEIDKSNLSTNSQSNAEGLCSYVTYNINKKPTGYGLHTSKYVYKEGDYYIRFSYFDIGESLRNGEVCVVKGDTYEYEKYTEYKPLQNLENRVSTLEKDVADLKNNVLSITPPSKTKLELREISPLYTVINDVNENENYAQGFWIDHIIPSSTPENKDLGFGFKRNKVLRFYEDVTDNYSEITTVEKTITSDIQSDDFEFNNFNFKLRGIKNSLTENKFPKVLVIGDSVTDGYLSYCNKNNPDSPNQYWAWVKYYFEKDKLSSKDNNKYKYLSIGLDQKDGKVYGTASKFKLNEKVYNCYAVGKGGWALNNLLEPIFKTETNINPFYNPETSQFSIKYFVDNFKTLADDGETRLEVGSTAGKKVTNVNEWDVCTPTHVVINLNHNTSLENYKNNITTIINSIKKEYPNMIIIIMSIDETGTFFPLEYPNYDSKLIRIGYLHQKNIDIYKYVKENVENENNKTFVCSGHIVQPSVESFPTLNYLFPEDSSNHFNGKSLGSGPNYHPNNHAHSAWGYQLYCLIKWTSIL